MSTANGTHSASSTDADLDVLYAWMPGLSPAPAPCPEALFSLTLKGTLDGHEALLTARGMTAAEFRANLEAIRGLLDATAPTPPVSTHQLTPAQHNALAMHRPITQTGWCAVHDVEMKWNEGKEGRKGWHSHRVGDTWCKGK